MRASGQVVLLLSVAALSGCQSAPKLPPTPAPAACQLAAFGVAPGLELVKPKKLPKNNAPNAIPVNQSISAAGAWVDAGSGWRAWRYWLRSEQATAVSVRIQPFELPPGAEFWLCSPDRTTRRGPVTGKGFGDVGQYRSPEVLGPELWLEVLAPAGAEKNVAFVIAEAFAAGP
jgi:hypothetical protein